MNVPCEKPAAKTLLVLHPDATGSPMENQLLPLGMYAGDLRRQLGWTVRSVCTPKLTDVAPQARACRADAIVLMTSWRDPADAIIAAIQDLRRLPYQPHILFFDYYAPTSSPHWSVLPFVDLYVKRQILRDRTQYQRALAGGFVFTDFLVREMGYNLDGWYSGPPPDADQVAQAVPGWNLGITPRFRRLLRISRLLPGRWRNRPLAVHRRFLPPPSNRPREWYDQYREYALRISDTLQPRWRCTAGDRVSRKRYLWELMRSRIVLSPFGWGELCFRDYEAVACGALLVKPSMDHLETSPDIFRSGETYVPLKWDLSDLQEKVTYHLKHPQESERIVARAQDVLWQYYERGGFVRDLDRIMSRVNPGTHAPASRGSSPVPCSESAAHAPWSRR